MANVFDQFDQDVAQAQQGGSVNALPNQPAPATTDGSNHGGTMEDAGQRWGIPQGLMSALMSKESSGNAGATSSKGAIGLGQVMPGTASDMGYDVDKMRNDPAMQADASAQYLSKMYQRYGDWKLALQAYHDGPGNTDAMIKGKYTPGPEGANYVDSRFDQWTNAGANDANSVEPTQYATSAKTGGNVFDQFGEYSPARADENQAPADAANPAPATQGDQQATGAQPAGAQPSPYADYEGPTSLGEDLSAAGDVLADAGKGVARAATNVLNIPIDVANMAQSGAAWAAEKAGVGDGTFTPIPRGGIPGVTGDQDMSEGAKLGADLISAFATIPAGGAGTAAKAPAVARELAELAGTASPEVASLLSRLGGFVESRIAAPAARATPGAIASSNGNEDQTALGIAAGPIGEGVVSAAGAAARKAAPVVRDAIDAIRPAADDAGPEAGSIAARNASESAVGDAAQQANRRFTQRGAVTDEAGNTTSAPQAAIDLANAADVDQAVLRSAGKLGMSDSLTPAAYARDPQFRSTVQALASRSGGMLHTKEAESVAKLADQADKLIADAGGDATANSIDQAFRQQVKQTIDNLGNKADDIYNTIGTKIPKDADVDPQNTLGYLWDKADTMKGTEYLSAAEKKALDWLQPVGADAATPTYSRLDTLRKQVGQAINKKSGPFKDEEAGALKQLYGRLTEDQEAVAAKYGADQDWAVGKQLVQRRKELEEQAIGALGKDLDGSATSKAQSAILDLGRKGGDPKAWNNLIRNTPESMRGQVVANALQRTFTAGSRKEQSLHVPGFVDWYNTARSNGTLTQVMQHLPRDLRARYGHIARVANGMRRAQSQTLQTGKLTEFVDRFDKAGGALNKLYGTAGTIAQHAGAFLALGPLGNVAVETGRQALKNRVSRSVLADNLLASDQFGKLMQAAAKGDKPATRAAEDTVSKMADWRELVKDLPEAEKAQIGRVGITGWLNSGQASGAN